MYTYTWYQWISFFFIYCFFGWIFESTYVSLKKGYFVNRGFLRLPMLPLYGTGAIMMLWVSIPVEDNLVMVYFVGVIAATMLEYVTGYVMERLFKMKYWDYSNQPFNLQGYICLSSSIAWGFLTLFLTEIIHKPIEAFVLSLSPMLDTIIIAVIGTLFIVDAIGSVKEALDLGRVLESMSKVKGQLEELQLQISLLKLETTQKITDFKDDTIQKAANLKGEADLKIFQLKHENDVKKKEKEEHPSTTLAELTARLEALTEKQRSIFQSSGIHNFYRRHLLQGNPSLSSRQFNDAIRDLKELLNVKKSREERKEKKEK